MLIKTTEDTGRYKTIMLISFLSLSTSTSDKLYDERADIEIYTSTSYF